MNFLTISYEQICAEIISINWSECFRIDNEILLSIRQLSMYLSINKSISPSCKKKQFSRFKKQKLINFDKQLSSFGECKNDWR